MRVGLDDSMLCLRLVRSRLEGEDGEEGGVAKHNYSPGVLEGSGVGTEFRERWPMGQLRLLAAENRGKRWPVKVWWKGGGSK